VTTTPTRQDIQVDVDRGLRRDVGRIGLLFTGVGSIIGSGWLFGALTAGQIAGPASIVSWTLGGAMMILIGLTYAELGPMLPVAGGVIRYPHYAFGSFTSYTAGWTTWLSAAATAPIEVLASIEYTSVHLTWLTTESGGQTVLTGPGLVVSIALMAVYSLINVLGIKAFARFNNILVWWKLAIIVLVVVAFLFTAFHASHFSDANLGGFAPNGWDNVFTALPTGGIVFAYLGFRSCIEFAGESSNPQRTVPYAVIGSIALCGVIYIALQVAFVGALPDHTLADGWANLSFSNDAGPLAGLASLVALGWLATLLYIDAIISPADTGLIFAAVTTRLSYAQARNGNAPQWLTKLNGRGVPWLSVALMFVVGCIFFLPFPSWQRLVGFITSATVLTFGTGPLALSAMRRTLPGQSRPFRLGGGDVVPFLAFAAANLIVFWTGWATNAKVFSAVAIGYIVLAIYSMVAKESMPPLDMRAGSWVLPWLAGLALFSYLGEYDGGKDVIGFGWGIIVILAFSAAIFVWALKVALPADRVMENVEKTPTDEPTGMAG